MYSVVVYGSVLMAGVGMSGLARLAMRGRPWVKRVNLVFVYLVCFNFPFRYYLQSCLSLFIFSTQQIRLSQFSALDIVGVCVSLVYLITFVVFFFLLMYFILKKLKDPKTYSLKIIDIYSGMRKSRFKIFLFNFWFISLRLAIALLANILSLIIPSPFLSLLWTLLMAIQLTLNFFCMYDSPSAQIQSLISDIILLALGLFETIDEFALWEDSISDIRGLEMAMTFSIA
jgi:hypothetical protein